MKASEAASGGVPPRCPISPEHARARCEAYVAILRERPALSECCMIAFHLYLKYALLVTRLYIPLVRSAFLHAFHLAYICLTADFALNEPSEFLVPFYHTVPILVSYQQAL